MTKKTIVMTSAAPAAIGPFSQAVGYGGMLFLSAQRGVDPHSGNLVSGGATEQARRCMENVRALLHASGLDFSHVVRVVIYLKNLSDLYPIENIYGDYFDENPPARTVIEVNRLEQDAVIEVEVTAAAPRAPELAAAAEEE